ncbi:MAG: hypothetical protein IPL20_03135 [Saprospiraceae bacterium]|nr:hypothetical protein [Saprospiraceae bacterium]
MILVNVHASKHISVPILAFLIVSKKSGVIQNLPDISDVNYMLKSAKRLGFSITEFHNKTFINANNYTLNNLVELEDNIRQNLLFLPMCIYHDITYFPIPQGDVIGQRPVDGYYDILRKFGFSSKVEEKCIKVKREKIETPSELILEVDSTGLTILSLTLVILLLNEYSKNIIDKVVIKNVSADLEVKWFIDFLLQNNISQISNLIEYKVNEKEIIFHTKYQLKDMLEYTISNDRVVLFDLNSFASLYNKKYY